MNNSKNLINSNILVLRRANYDKSKKPYEILYKDYDFDKYGRNLMKSCNPLWRHYRYYDTLEAAEDAIKEFRKKGKSENISQELESKYPHITPRVTFRRYAIWKRTDI